MNRYQTESIPQKSVEPLPIQQHNHRQQQQQLSWVKWKVEMRKSCITHSVIQFEGGGAIWIVFVVFFEWPKEEEEKEES